MMNGKSALVENKQVTEQRMMGKEVTHHGFSDASGTWEYLFMAVMVEGFDG